MLPEPLKSFSSQSISNILFNNQGELMSSFYDMQSHFLTSRYKMNKSIETSNILTYLARNLHLEIVRQREKDLNYNISLNNFLENQHKIETHGHKIVSIVNTTGIPKETVRRKIKKLISEGTVTFDKKNKEYFWNLRDKNFDIFIKFMNEDIKSISKFILSISDFLNLNLKLKNIEEEIKSQFSFYYYHYYSCQLEWMKMWQTKLKDVDLIFITIQALMPTLKYCSNLKNIDLNNFHTIVGKMSSSTKNDTSINANSISQISGIPRATCLRKLEKLVNLGMLVREVKTKRYHISQNLSDRSKHITRKENITYTIQLFSEFLSVVISSLTRDKK